MVGSRLAAFTGALLVAGALFGCARVTGPEAPTPSEAERVSLESRARARVPTPLSTGPTLMLSVDSPAPGDTIGGSGGLAFVSGTVISVAEGPYQTSDLLIVVDVSDSTALSSGIDVDGDGRVSSQPGALEGLLPGDPPDVSDSVLAAELLIVERLLAQLDPRATRVGLIEYAGDGDEDTPDATLRVPLTSDYARVRTGIEGTRKGGSLGRSNLAEGLRLAVRELSGLAGAVSAPQLDAEPVLLLFSDGTPTLPSESGEQSARLAMEELERAESYKIQLHILAAGRDLPEPGMGFLEALASDFEGELVRFRSRERLEESVTRLRGTLPRVRWAPLESLSFRNVTTGSEATYQLESPDGQLAALVSMQPGENEIEVRATAAGLEERRRVALRFDPGAGTQKLSLAQRRARNSLLERRLEDLRRPASVGAPAR